MSEPTKATVAAVLERDQRCCVVCGMPTNGIRGYGWSIHHRQPRGMGGSKAPHINAASNLVVVCGHGTYGCHGEIERHRADSERIGILVRRPWKPVERPVFITGPAFPNGSMVYLTDDGRYSTTAPAEVTA